MALILSIETSTKVCSIAIHNNEKLITNKLLNIEKSHSEYLLQMIDHLFSYIPFNKNNLDAIAISQGPGSYTGLRVGISIAKGLCFGLDIPLIAINTLEIMINEVSRFNHQNNILCPMIDARRNEVYCMLAKKKYLKELKIIENINAKIIDQNSFSKILEKEKILFFGDGASKCQSLISNPNAIFIKDIISNARFMGDIAYHKLCNKEFEDLDYFEPLYLKSPI